MEHYIKVEYYRFDEVKGLLSLKLYFDIEEGSQKEDEGTLIPNTGWYSGLEFESIQIDTQNSFVCSTEASTQATTITSENIGEMYTEQYYKYTGDALVLSTRKVWDITINLNEVTSGVLSSLRNYKDSLLFIFVNVKGNYKIPDQYEGWITQQPMSVMFSLYDYKELYNLVYSKLSNSVSNDSCTCFDKCAANAIILLNGVESSLRLERWRDAIQFWKPLHRDTDSKIYNPKRCNCHAF